MGANEQHYEVPTVFFESHLGPHNKYSSCEWNNAASLEEAETQTFDSYIDKMDLASVPKGGSVLEVGCGWGFFLLYVAKKYPNINFVGFSNSSTQIEHINSKELKNARGVKLDINDFCCDMTKRNNALLHGENKLFDRIISIECLEHSRNYYLAFKAMSEVLKEDTGRVFIQILCHREYTYFMNEDDWMGRNFFTGGTIPSTKLFMFFNDHLAIDDTWYVSGRQYSKTLDSWLHQMTKKRSEVENIFRKAGYKNPELEFQKWRMFYLMSSVSFSFNKGNDWMVAYYSLVPRKN